MASRFLDEFERVAELLAAEPVIAQHTEGGRRGFPLHGFQYSVIYRAFDDGLRILVVRHQHRDPDFGEARK